MTNVETTQFLEEIARESTGTDQEVAAQFTGLSSTQMNWKPAGTDWSIGQEFDHILRANRPYITEMRRVIAAAGNAQADLQTQLLGQADLQCGQARQEHERPLFQSRLSRPRLPWTRASSASIWRFRKRSTNCLRKPGRRISTPEFTSPLAAIAKMRLGDAFRITAAHNRRHVDKAQRLLNDPNFP